MENKTNTNNNLILVGRFFFVTKETEARMESLLNTLQTYNKKWNRSALLRKALHMLDTPDGAQFPFDGNTIFEIPSADIIKDVEQRDKLKIKAAQEKKSMVELVATAVDMFDCNFKYVINPTGATPPTDNSDLF